VRTVEFTKVKYKKSGCVAEITLDNPKRLNSVDLAMLQELRSMLSACEEDKEVKVIVLSGEGNSFCAGADLQSIMEAGPDDIPFLIKNMARVAGDAAIKIRHIEKPVIASLKGVAAGAGLNLALVSDFRIAADNCRFIQAFVNVGLIPDAGGTFILNRLIGVGKATELIMTGRTITSEEARAMGLLTKVVPLDDLEHETLKSAEDLAKAPGEAIRRMKTLMNRYVFSDFETYVENEVEYQFECAKTQDFLEGVNAFLEKRKPRFVSK